MPRSLGYIEGVRRIATKSRRALGSDSSSGTETSSAACVTSTKASASSRLAARNESGSCVASSAAVASASRAPSRRLGWRDMLEPLPRRGYGVCKRYAKAGRAVALRRLTIA